MTKPIFIVDPRVNWHNLSIHILEQNLDKVRWMVLSSNTGSWGALSSNEDAIHILEKNLDKVN